MTHHKESDDDLDTQGLLLVMFNAIQALAIAHPNRAAVRDVLERAGEQQLELFEAEAAETELIEAYGYYSERLLTTIPDANVPIDIDLDLKLG